MSCNGRAVIRVRSSLTGISSGIGVCPLCMYALGWAKLRCPRRRYSGIGVCPLCMYALGWAKLRCPSNDAVGKRSTIAGSPSLFDASPLSKLLIHIQSTFYKTRTERQSSYFVRPHCKHQFLPLRPLVLWQVPLDKVLPFLQPRLRPPLPHPLPRHLRHAQFLGPRHPSLHPRLALHLHASKQH